MKRVAVVMAIAAMVPGCGGSDDGGAEASYTQDEIATALEFHREHGE
jgi:hypothetical protein